LRTDFTINYQGCISCGHSLCAKKVSLFSNLSESQLTAVIDLIERVFYKRGECVLRQGEDLDRLYIVNSGSLKASTYSEDGKEQILYFINEGDTIGELALLKIDEAPYHLIAVKDTNLCTIPKESFDEFVRKNPEVVLSVLASAHERIVSLERLVGVISSNDADVRLKYLLTKLMDESGRMTQKGIVIQLGLSREDMANFVGVTRETISRKLHQLIEQGIIEMNNPKKITILDQEYFLDKR